MNAPLHGVRVVDFTRVLSGPCCTKTLRDLGADVTKIEPPAGDVGRAGVPHIGTMSTYYAQQNAGKRNICIDLNWPEARAIAKRLCEDADVVVENFRPGTFERWGLAPDRLFELNPGLVLARLTGWGQSGPYAHRAGFGTLAEAMSGFAHLTGPADGPPTLPAFGLADSICGIAASSAVLMALRHREVQGGGGQVVDMSILEPIMTAVGPAPTVYDQLGIVEQRHGNRSTNNAPRNAYRTKDGSWVAVSTSAQTIAERVLRLVGHPEVVAEPWFRSGRGRVEHVDLLDRYVGDWIGDRTRAEVLAAFDAAGAAVAPIYDPKDIVEDPHIRATGMITEVEDEDLGRMLMHNVMWRMSATPGSIRFTGRPLGADTDAVLVDELGYERAQVAALRERGAVA